MTKFKMQNKNRRELLDNQKPKTQEGIDKETKISKLKSQIKSCEYDLSNGFKGNEIVKHKLAVMKEELLKMEKDP